MGLPLLEAATELFGFDEAVEIMNSPG